LFDKLGESVAYLTDDYHNTIYLWDGHPVAYLDQDRDIYGINGQHLGWFIDGILYNHSGERIGFTAGTCLAPLSKELTKSKKYPLDQLRPKWTAPPLPKLSFQLAEQHLEDFLRKGQVKLFQSGIKTTMPVQTP
jgi:hypothetical protein